MVILTAKTATASNQAAVKALAAAIHARVATDHATKLKAEKLLLEAEKGLNANHEPVSMTFNGTWFLKGGILSAQEWKTWFAGTIQRHVSPTEARDRLAS